MRYICERCKETEAEENGAYCKPCRDKGNLEFIVNHIGASINSGVRQGFTKKQILDAVKEKYRLG